MVNVKTEIDKTAQKALSKNVIIFCIASIVVGSVGLLTFIVLYAFFESAYLDLLLLFSIPFALGLVYLIMINKNIKNMAESKITNEYNFNEDSLNVTCEKNGEIFGTQKVYYKDIYKVREVKDYIFIYINATSAYIIKKSNATDEEIAIIKRLLKIDEKNQKVTN